jgi:site-specific DNA-methyltransferase (adenine-specific)
MSNFQILQGDCIEMMRTLPDNSVNCCVTSPPYFGLRDYGCDGQIGMEETPDAFIAQLVSVFREVKRVLKDDGTLWVNIGDSYFNKQNSNRNGLGGSLGDGAVRGGGEYKTQKRNAGTTGCKEKDLIGIPWMLAFALRADGWYLRQDIIWHKPNPMPESATDRCTKAHEYIFLLTKSPKYYFDHKAMQEKAVSAGKPRQFGATKQEGTLRNDVGRVFEDNGLRNKRSVWTVNVKPYKEAHFATYPPELITPCILAGCPEGGTVLDPFGGSGTTAQVALQNKRNAILCELNPDYVKIIEKRLASIDPLFNSHE